MALAPVDDFDGTPADGTVRFTLFDGTYELDLTAEHEAQLRAHLKRYLRKARRLDESRTASAAEMREWARRELEGAHVPERGPLPPAIKAAYAAAHAGAPA